MRTTSRWRALALFAAVLALASVGCAGDKRTYNWSSYQNDLRNQMSGSPESASKFEATLKRIIERSDSSGHKAPPGLMAEYGFILYQRGEKESAISYFEREAREWPESASFMKRIIEDARGGSGS